MHCLVIIEFAWSGNKLTTVHRVVFIFIHNGDDSETERGEEAEKERHFTIAFGYVDGHGLGADEK